VFDLFTEVVLSMPQSAVAPTSISDSPPPLPFLPLSNTQEGVDQLGRRVTSGSSE
jgi:hypothetical protein